MSSEGARWLDALCVVALTAAILVGAAPAASPASKKPIEFKDGIKVLDSEKRGQKVDWTRVADLMSKANVKDEEDGEQARIDGNDYRAYLPLYYLGLALYNTKNCAGARDHWKKSIELGFVKQDLEKFKLVKEYMEKLEKCK